MKTKEQKTGLALSIMVMATIVIGTILLRHHRGLYIDKINEWWFGWILTRIVVPFMLPVVMPVISLLSVRLHRMGIYIKAIAVSVVLTICLAYMALGAEVYGWFSTLIFIAIFLFGCFVWGIIAWNTKPYCPNCYTGLFNVERKENGCSEIKRTSCLDTEMYALSSDAKFEESKHHFYDIISENRKDWQTSNGSNNLTDLYQQLNWVKSHPIFKNVYHATYNYFDQYYSCTCNKCSTQFEMTEAVKKLASYEITHSEDATGMVIEWVQKRILNEEKRRERDAELEAYAPKSRPKKTLGGILSSGISDLYGDVTGQTKYVVVHDGKKWTGKWKYKIRKRRIWDTMRDDVRPETSK